MKFDSNDLTTVQERAEDPFRVIDAKNALVHVGIKDGSGLLVPSIYLGIVQSGEGDEASDDDELKIDEYSALTSFSLWFKKIDVDLLRRLFQYDSYEDVDDEEEEWYRYRCNAMMRWFFCRSYSPRAPTGGELPHYYGAPSTYKVLRAELA